MKYLSLKTLPQFILEFSQAWKGIVEYFYSRSQSDSCSCSIFTCGICTQDDNLCRSDSGNPTKHCSLASMHITEIFRSNQKWCYSCNFAHRFHNWQFPITVTNLFKRDCCYFFSYKFPQSLFIKL